MKIQGRVVGLESYAWLGFHVHSVEYDGLDCGSAGGHFNPQEVNHGAYYNDVADRHVGDWKMLNTRHRGDVNYRHQDYQSSLFEEDDYLGFENYIGDRSLVIHAGEDDLGLGGDDGSIASGNAGARIACCNIVMADEITFRNLQYGDYTRSHSHW